MVHTGTYLVHTGMNSVHTTGHYSRCVISVYPDVTPDIRVGDHRSFLELWYRSCCDIRVFLISETLVSGTMISEYHWYRRSLYCNIGVYQTSEVLWYRSSIWNRDRLYVLSMYWYVLGTYHAIVLYLLVLLCPRTYFYPKYVLVRTFCPKYVLGTYFPFEYVLGMYLVHAAEWKYVLEAKSTYFLSRLPVCTGTYQVNTSSFVLNLVQHFSHFWRVHTCTC